MYLNLPPPLSAGHWRCQYASYWNAFLFKNFFVEIKTFFFFSETTTEDPTQNEVLGKIVFFSHGCQYCKIITMNSCANLKTLCILFSIKLLNFFNFTFFKIMNIKLMFLSAAYPGSLTLNQPFTPELSNPDTPEFQEAEDNFCSQVMYPLVTLKGERVLNGPIVFNFMEHFGN